MEEARWIWYPGDFEIYHSNLVHSRREDFGVAYPCFWMQASVYPRVDFTRTVELSEPETLTIYTRSYGMLADGNKRYPLNEEITLPAGRHELLVRLLDASGLPAIFIDSPHIKTNSSWLASDGSVNTWPAGDEPAFLSARADPRVFPFAFQTWKPVSQCAVNGGVLYDFGRETFCRVELTGVSRDNAVFICYGESREEALDPDQAFTRQKLAGKTSYSLPARAFRYLWLHAEKAEEVRLRARYEYLPVRDIGSFSCDDPTVKKIWEVCAYTFHLNSREFYQDGIKRDRWVWSGDSYQSFMINRYLYFEPSIIRRTILCLLGKPPYEQHINTINDYSLYLLMGIGEYYESTGDEAFVRFVFPRARALYNFIVSRLDENGLMVQRPGDWIFIDWSEMDKSGPLCAEQILLWQAEKTMGTLAAICGEDDKPYRTRAARLKKTIMAAYWDEEKHAFIDTFAGTRRHVTRHANIFAVLYNFVGAAKQREIRRWVLDNDTVTPITTPYFKLYELEARCRLGDLAYAQKLLDSYWGGMLRLGATSVWEQFDPNATGTEHYAMYGEAYGCSLCHAWGSGPIFLLGRYCLGVYPTSVGGRTFCVEPKAGLYKSFQGTAPLMNGTVRVVYEKGVLTVTASRAGGTLKAGGKVLPLEANVPLTVHCRL